MFVVRGKDWISGTQDYEKGMPGEGMIYWCNDTKWASVTWDGGSYGEYRIGAENSFDLYHAGNKTSIKAYCLFSTFYFIF